jgi:hypothetical protein
MRDTPRIAQKIPVMTRKRRTDDDEVVGTTDSVIV